MGDNEDLVFDARLFAAVKSRRAVSFAALPRPLFIHYWTCHNFINEPAI